MIKTIDMVPEVYYKESRDFQIFGRIFDIVFNYLKYNSNTISNYPLSKNSNKNLLELLCTTLGFKSLRNYNDDQLNILCSIFSLLIKNKGNIKSIELLLNILANVENIHEVCEVTQDIHNSYNINIFIPSKVKNITLFEDVLNYILPAGMQYKIIRQNFVRNDDSKLETNFNFNTDSDKIKAYIYKDIYSSLVRYNQNLKEEVSSDPDLDVIENYENLNTYNKLLKDNSVKTFEEITKSYNDLTKMLTDLSEEN